MNIRFPVNDDNYECVIFDADMLPINPDQINALGARLDRIRQLCESPQRSPELHTLILAIIKEES